MDRRAIHAKSQNQRSFQADIVLSHLPLLSLLRVLETITIQQFFVVIMISIRQTHGNDGEAYASSTRETSLPFFPVLV